jgi:hypothetical protein
MIVRCRPGRFCKSDPVAERDVLKRDFKRGRTMELDERLTLAQTVQPL